MCANAARLAETFAGIAAILPNPRKFKPNGSSYISNKQAKIARYILMTKLKYYSLQFLYNNILGETEKAEEYFLKAAELEDSNVMNALGMICSARGQMEKTEEWFLKGAKLGNKESRKNLVILYEHQGKFDEAIKYKD